MVKKKSALLIFTILLTSCTTQRYSVVQACSIEASQAIIKLDLNPESTIEDYQRALITRKAELNLKDRDIARIRACVDELSRG